MLISQDGNFTGITADECQCGQPYVIVQPGETGRTIAYLLAVAATEGSERVDVFVAGNGAARCYCCGQLIQIPNTEMLDPDRDPLIRRIARWIQAIL